MGKIKLEFKTPKKKMIEHNGKNIEVTPFLSLSQQVFLINRYAKEYFSPENGGMVDISEYDYLGAEYALMNYIFQTVTNIDVEDIDSNIYSDSVLFQKITSEIVNYNDFRNKLYSIIMEIKEQKTLNNSAGKIFSDFIDKAYLLLDKIGNIAPEEIQKARTSGEELVKVLKESSILENPKK